MKYLTIEQVIHIHDQTIKKIGGIEGLRDRSLLESAIASPMTTIFQKEMYPSVIEKGACYLFSICKNHPFVDGNKRTATICCLIFLRQNGEKIFYNKKEFEDFVCALADSKMDRGSVVVFLREKCIASHESRI